MVIDKTINLPDPPYKEFWNQVFTFEIPGIDAYFYLTERRGMLTVRPKVGSSVSNDYVRMEEVYLWLADMENDDERLNFLIVALDYKYIAIEVLNKYNVMMKRYFPDESVW